MWWGFLKNVEVISLPNMAILWIYIAWKMRPGLITKNYGEHFFIFNVTFKVIEKPVAIILTRSEIFRFQFMQHWNPVKIISFLFQCCTYCFAFETNASSFAARYADVLVFSSICSFNVFRFSSDRACGLPLRDLSSSLMLFEIFRRFVLSF